MQRRLRRGFAAPTIPVAEASNPSVEAFSRGVRGVPRETERAPRALLPRAVPAHRAHRQLAVDGDAVAALRAVELALDVLARGAEGDVLRRRVLDIRPLDFEHQRDPLCITLP